MCILGEPVGALAAHSVANRVPCYNVACKEKTGLFSCWPCLGSGVFIIMAVFRLQDSSLT